MPPLKPADSGWAKLREAQREAVAADKNAALIVTIDIGDRYDVHPANKQEVGRRLALAARKLVFGENVMASGPVAIHAVREGRRIAVRFDDVEKGLVTFSSAEPIGFELCGKTCSYASAEIAHGEIQLAIPAKTTPAWVRYCWADGPICTLFDGAGLPAAPFDLPIETGHKGAAMKPHTRHARR
jgi:sialate O-acetylesterase